jgi:hypothetical protein
MSKTTANSAYQTQLKDEMVSRMNQFVAQHEWTLSAHCGICSILQVLNAHAPVRGLIQLISHEIAIIESHRR